MAGLARPRRPPSAQPLAISTCGEPRNARFLFLPPTPAPPFFIPTLFRDAKMWSGAVFLPDLLLVGHLRLGNYWWMDANLFTDHVKGKPLLCDQLS